MHGMKAAAWVACGLATWAGAVRGLLGRGADPNAVAPPDDRNVLDGPAPWPALLVAAHRGAVPPVRLLLDAGAALEGGDESGETALMVAADGGRAAGPVNDVGLSVAGRGPAARPAAVEDRGR